MPDPFFRGYDPYDLFAGALVAKSQDWGSAPDALQVLNAIEPGENLNVAGTVTVPAFVASITASTVYVAVRGTSGWAQWTLDLLGSPQVPIPGIPGKVAAYFGLLAIHIGGQIVTWLAGRLAGKRLVLIGHSLGGAVCQCLIPLLQPGAPSQIACWCYGAPRVGDPAFALAVTSKVFRVENTDDPVVGVPPVLWAGVGSHYPLPGPGIASVYTHGGQVKTVKWDGSLVDGDNGVSLASVWQALAEWEAPTHLTKEYVDRLRSGLNLYPIPPEVGYADGASLVAVYSSDSPGPAPKKGVLMPYLTQGIMFFRSNNGPQEGWEEAVYFSSEVDAVLSLLKNILIPARTAFLSNQAEIHGYRAARADGTRLSKTNKPLAPYVGQLSIPVNEFSDAIEYRFRDAGGASRLWPFRAVPDTWISGQKLSADGIAGAAIIDVFGNLVVNNGGSLKVPYGANPKIAIAIIGNDPAAGGPIKITTTAAHGLVSGQLVNITGLTGYPYLRGHWRVSVVDALNFKLVGSQRYNVDILVSTGTWQLVEYVSSALASFSFNGVGDRKCGAPFGQVRGKQSAVTLHH